MTAEDVLEVLAGKLEESSLIRNSEVLVDGFTGFTPVQIGVLGKLFRLCEKVYVTIIMDEREDPYKKAIPHQLFAMSRQLIQQLMKAHSIGICYEGGLDKNGRPADTRTPALAASAPFRRKNPHGRGCPAASPGYLPVPAPPAWRKW